MKLKFPGRPIRAEGRSQTDHRQAKGGSETGVGRANIFPKLLVFHPVFCIMKAGYDPVVFVHISLIYPFYPYGKENRAACSLGRNSKPCQFTTR